MSNPHEPGTLHSRGRAIVIGGSIAGLVAARVLSPRFGRVTILDRDRLPAVASNRLGVPQGWHGHGLLASGFRVLTSLLPGLEADLLEAGTVAGDVVGDLRWFQKGCYKAKFASGLRGVLLSRALLESTVRKHVLALPNVDLVDGTHVVGLTMDATRRRVTGVRLRNDALPGTELLDAALVVDASGRATRTPEWLAELGFGRPDIDEVKVGLGYTTRTYRRLPEHLDGDLGAIIVPTPPHETRCGFAAAMEGDRWIVSLCGWTGDHAPATPEGFLAYARSLPRPEIYDLARTATPLTDPVSFAFPASVRRRYERMRDFPQRYVVVGDAIACFNPIYGQGMSVGALEGEALEQTLDESAGLDALGPRFFARAAKLIDTPWTMAVGSDFAFKGVTGPKPVGTSLVNRYLDRVHEAASTDRTVCRTFFDVANLLAPPTSLFRPRIVARVAVAALMARPCREFGPAGRVVTATPMRPHQTYP
jgi:2-polyprenyl-6-methoxyphenol hydroxylase-like FAD-dependent oxidoreductase